MGRRARFDLWESKSWGESKGILLTKDKAEEKWGKGKIRRARCYSALNRIIQGSAADIFKSSLLAIKRSGVFNTLGCPINLVHDEICYSVPNTKEGKEAHEESLHLMKTTTKLSVPLLVDSEGGPSWGEVK